MILEWLERYANIFKDPITKCVNNFESGGYGLQTDASGKPFMQVHVGGGYVAEVTDFYAIGYGHQYSEAALYLGHSPQEAVKVACDLCCFVDGPIVTKTMTKD